MSLKVKKVNSKKKTNNKKEKDPNKFHLGRNLGTFLIFLGGIIVLVFIYAIFHVTLIGENSYYKVYKANEVSAYVTDNPKDGIIEDFTVVEHDSFDDLDVKFYATSFDSHDAHSASFSLAVAKNANSPDLYGIDNSSLTFSSSSNYRVYAYVCLAANWIGMCKYSSGKNITENAVNKTIDETTSYTMSVALTKTVTDEDDNDVTENCVFPASVSTWPIKVSVKAPDAYVFLAYVTQENGKYTVHQVVLHYSYSDYCVAGKTVPAI